MPPTILVQLSCYVGLEGLGKRDKNTTMSSKLDLILSFVGRIINGKIGMKWEFGRQNLYFFGGLVFNRLLLSMKNLNSKIFFKE